MGKKGKDRRNRNSITSIRMGKVKGLLEAVEQEWQEARRARPDECAVSTAIAQDGPVWIVVLKLPSGASFSCETDSEKGIFIFLVNLSERLTEGDDLTALVSVIQSLAVRVGDQDVLDLVNDCFPETVPAWPF